MYQTILVPLDGSKRAEAILSHVESIAKSNNAKVLFLKVEEEPIMLERDEVIDIEKYHEVFDKQNELSQAYLDDLKARFHEKDIQAVTQLAFGSVVKAILNTAAETGTDLIAMATHGLSGLARVSYGSVAAGVLQAADIPILLIRSCSDKKRKRVDLDKRNHNMSKKWVYLFDEVDQAEKYVDGEWEKVRGLLGGKGANLAEMTRIEVPVPPGFTITTEACNAYLASGETFPEGMWDQVLKTVAGLEKESGKKFGDRQNPLLVSCRSGAKFSMPGMMDTILNIGLNDETAKGLIELTGNERFVYDSFRRLIQMFGSVVTGIPDEVFEEKINECRSRAGVKTDAELGAEDLNALTQEFKRIFRRHTTTNFPGEPHEQLKMAIDAVFKSWNGKRAVDYRNASAIPHDLGTAVNIVTMVFGNSGDDCATGVALTRNGTTGENRIEGDYLINAQGEDVVAGIRQTNDLSQLKSEMPDIYAQFEQIVRRLETHYREMQDVEFTVEKGKLWMLQTRSGKRTAQAAVRIAVDMAEEKLITKQEAVLRITPEQVDFFLHPQFEREVEAVAKAKGAMLATGLNVSPGAAVGIVAFDADLAEMWAKEE